MSPLQQVETEALKLAMHPHMPDDTGAIVLLVQALRIYRQAAKRLLKARYADGECSGADLSTFECALESAEELGQK